ncbi:TetR/AcrR family transcriptional regulator [Hoeflea sp.]|uniref:TetR/AcrR family transcriptional regulator n=1 Tax=Hoeflea sp. TaxID=1940281 RepID=UPI0019CA9A3B|nr:TetR/AcrR family transcriptional regulator [Hoeflea sp.]MBC7282841.1 TetR/AcrR family transcriptional regulator [Hoeflea sp.]
MSERDQQILEAAIAQFSRYGVRKATMGDIAAGAGISRQTLYARYANKAEIIDAAMRLITEKVVGQVSEAWLEAGSISEKLDIFLDYAIVRFFDQVKQMPDSIDLMTGSGDGGTSARHGAEQGKIDLLAGLFEARRDKLTANGTSPRDLADFFYQGSASFLFTARDLGHLKALLASLKRTTLMMLGES